MRILAQPELKNWEPFVFFDKAFTPSECETIISIGLTIQPSPAQIGGQDGKPAQDEKIRSSELRWLNPSGTSNWIFDRLSGICDTIRLSWYPFHLSGFVEPIQLTRYLAEENGHYETHMDMGGEKMSTRKLSLVALLSDPKEFQGGALEIFAIPGEDKQVKQLTQGCVIAFPSWQLHRVSKITSGIRWSLVAWVHGPVFT